MTNYQNKLARVIFRLTAGKNSPNHQARRPTKHVDEECYLELPGSHGKLELPGVLVHGRKLVSLRSDQYDVTGWRVEVDRVEVDQSNCSYFFGLCFSSLSESGEHLRLRFTFWPSKKWTRTTLADGTSLVGETMTTVPLNHFSSSCLS